jgi:hypothetical protein
MKVLLGDVAHCRAGDKGDTRNLAVIPYDEADYDWLAGALTEELVADAFESLIEGSVTRHDVPGIRAFNFVLLGVRGGGSTKNLGTDIHAKSWAGVALGIEVDRP